MNENAEHEPRRSNVGLHALVVLRRWERAMVENDMRKPIVDWLAADGLEDAHECLLAGYCDVIGFRFHPRTGRAVPPLDCAIAVELKMSNVRQVITQARGNRPYVNASFAAMPRDRCERMRPRTLDKFRQAQVGLLAVKAGQVDVLIPAVWENDDRAGRRAKTWWRWHLRNQKKQDNAGTQVSSDSEVN